MFLDRAVSMGLKVVGDGSNQVAIHEGSLATVCYAPLESIKNDLFSQRRPGHIALYVKNDKNSDTPEENWDFNTILSDSYSFTSFESLIESAKQSIVRENTIIKEENLILGVPPVIMKHQIVVAHETTVNNNDEIFIYPTATVESSYNGTRANRMTFGILIEDRKTKSTLSLPIKKFGDVRSIHTESGKVDFSTPVGNLTSQMGNISEVISNMFNQTISEDTLGSFLITIDGIGKRAIQKISNDVNAIAGDSKTQWDIFRIMLEYTSTINTINIREKFEDAIEKFFNFPEAITKIIEDANK